jgi:hypothetical protein
MSSTLLAISQAFDRVRRQLFNPSHCRMPCASISYLGLALRQECEELGLPQRCCVLAATMEEDGGSFEEDDNQPIGEDCSINPHAPEQPDGEYSEGGESSYGSGDDSGSDSESSAPEHLQKKANNFFLGQRSQSPGRLSQNKKASSQFESAEEDPCQVDKDA